MAVPAAPQRKVGKGRRPPNRVDKLKAIDRFTGKGGPRRPGVLPVGPGQPVRRPLGAAGRTIPGQGPNLGNVPGQAPQRSHPFVPGAGLAPVVPATASEPGSPPGTPNLGAMVTRSFQPQVMERTPLVSNGAGVQPNQRFNFGGPNTAPPGARSMQQPQQPQPPQQPGQQPVAGAY